MSHIQKQVQKIINVLDNPNWTSNAYLSKDGNVLSILPTYLLFLPKGSIENSTRISWSLDEDIVRDVKINRTVELDQLVFDLDEFVSTI